MSFSSVNAIHTIVDSLPIPRGTSCGPILLIAELILSIARNV